MVNHGLKGPRCTGTCPQTSGKFEGTVVSASTKLQESLIKKKGGEEAKEMKTLKGIEVLALALALALALLTVSSVFPASATYPPNAVYFEPEYIEGGAKCNYSYTNIMVNTNVTTGGIGMDIYFDPECVNITDVDFTGSPYQPLFPPLWKHWVMCE